MPYPLSLPQLAAALLVVINLITFYLMGLDKSRARRKAREPSLRRIPERTLFTWAILGGGLGGTLGMRLFHHKTRHWYFRWGFPLLALAQLALVLWLWRARPFG